MILSLFSLCPEETPSIKESQIAIENAFKSILDEKYEFKNYSSEKMFLADFSTAIAEDSIIVATAEPEYFVAFKKFICNAFQMKTKVNKSVSAWIAQAHPDMLDEDIEPYADLPVNSTPLMSQDGINSGFGLKVKKQLLIILPLDVRRIDQIINASLLSYVRSNMDLSVLASDPLRGMTEEMSGLAKQAAEEAQVKTTERERTELYDTLAIRECVEKLASRGLTVALANTKTVDFLGNISKGAVSLNDVMFVSSFTAEKGEMTARDYSIMLAKGALANSINSVGAAVTKVFCSPDTDGVNQYYMYVCIADNENANVAKLMAEPDETPPHLIYRACEELFHMLSLWVDAGYATPQFADTNIATPVKATPSAVSAKLKKIKIAVSATIAASGVVSAIISLVLQNVYGV